MEKKEYDTVYYDEELGHDFASWVSGDSMEPKYPNGSVALIRETGFDYNGAVYAVVWNEQTYIKRVYLEEDGLRLVSINKNTKTNLLLMTMILGLSEKLSETLCLWRTKLWESFTLQKRACQ